MSRLPELDDVLDFDDITEADRIVLHSALDALRRQYENSQRSYGKGSKNAVALEPYIENVQTLKNKLNFFTTKETQS